MQSSDPTELRPLWHSTSTARLATHLHCMYHARQMALLSRILSRHWSFRPLKFFHFGDTNFPLESKTKRGRRVSRSSEVKVRPHHSRLKNPWLIHYRRSLTEHSHSRISLEHTGRVEHDNIQDMLQWVIRRGYSGLLLTLKVSHN